MKIKNNRHIKKYIIVAIVIVAVLAIYLTAAAFIRWYPFQVTETSQQKNSPKKVNDVNYDKPTADEQKAGSEAKQQSEESPSVYKPTPSTSPTQLAITSVSQENGVLEIRTTLSTLDESGKCSLSLEKAGETTISQEVGIQNMGSYSVCEGFNVSTTGLAKGDWLVTITYSGASPSASATQTIKVQ